MTFQNETQCYHSFFASFSRWDPSQVGNCGHGLRAAYRFHRIARTGVGVASTSHYEKTRSGHWPPDVPPPGILEVRLQKSFDERQQLAPLG
ncbi:uncharacterized protein B0T23DRAFT_401784 [Neurospora hispaniola]|uniref:Uncharacterized protein n=1 Tax=Neurospora hispaniola TaxID=588809 RepID=A0AAJ0MW33_9PEZI|nr:hypothetical protein B0T23DRAFT_401784 [Neurospora hispaniola]